MRDRVTRAVHNYQLANALGPLDVEALKRSALELLPSQKNKRSGQSPMLLLALAAGPFQRILRPSRLEEKAFISNLQKIALFSEPILFDIAEGLKSSISGSALVLEQERGASIQLDEQGALMISLPLQDLNQRSSSGFGSLAIIEETVVRQLVAALTYSDRVLELIDPTKQLTHVSLATRVDASEHLGWKTQAEHDASSNTSFSMDFGSEGKPPIVVDAPRAALRMDVVRLAEDLMVPLRRQHRRQRG